MNMKIFSFFTLYSILVVQITYASNYDNYLRQLEIQNQNLLDEFRNKVPNAEDLVSEYYSGMKSFQPDESIAASLVERSSEDGPDVDEGDTNSDAYWEELLKHYDKYFDMKYKASGNQEEMEQNNLWGEHKVSGGGGKSQGSKHEQIKTDKLPAYCNPPNPCPIGTDPEKTPSPCQENIPDSKEFNRRWIWDKMESGECNCDVEHMRSCSKKHHGNGDRRMSDEDQVNELDPDYIRNVYLSGNKHHKLVAKKAPKMWNTDHALKRSQPNPYLQGEALRSVMKKTGPTF